MQRHVSVAVPVPLHRTFTYAWPEGAAEPLAGQRVRVPFGPRKLTGLLLSPEASPEAGIRVKAISEVVDVEPIVPDALLRLAEFVAEYYVAPIGEVCRALLPAGMGPGKQNAPARQPLQRMVELLEGAGERLHELSRAPAQLRAVERLMEQGGRSAAGGVLESRVVSALLQRGLVRVTDDPVTPDLPAHLLAGDGGPFQLTPQQAEAVAILEQRVAAGREASILLHGITGSGKTEVYLRGAAAALAHGRGVILLVPEIGLTPALIGRLSNRFGDELAVLHSGIRPAQRRAHWHRIRRGEARIVLGARSAIFAPVRSLGLIVVDEEHDTSYKQDETPRYHARDLALVRGRLESCPVVLASATPSMETYARAERGAHLLVPLTRRIGRRGLPTFEVVDLRKEFREAGQVALLSRRLAAEIEQQGARGEQTMLLLNRRGWASFLLCRACGEAIGCKNCSVSLTLHRARGELLCHYCGHARPRPGACPDCREEALQEMGSGTERIEDELGRVLPGLRVLRMDADSVRREGHAAILGRFARGEADVLVGTQMIAKGHDFPGVTLVGILGGDALLGLPDFRAAEWTFQLATQAAGRAGRGEEAGRVILQAYRADHYALQHAREHDYAGFHAREDRFRKALLYPPHAVLASIRVQHPDAEEGARLSADIAALLGEDPDTGPWLHVLGPAPAPLARLRGLYRFHLLLKSKSKARLVSVLQRLGRGLEGRSKAREARIQIDMDTLNIL